ncbi:pentapeptide repeat-containing protein [Streptomyces sp. HP-A2021]|uniref:pentapeptide repeat-containing protein n=1 Tax=Streptomyces sp. HP-A2021 TaxID=2927875 RepID=UPI001FAE788E|nr:pentapeptide repeat-containing protein [Streptomyces sp. HP-A2021]UOB08015.1 pentapeptide repeat-containing protein [Streptomyces sp. HP-A2021]
MASYWLHCGHGATPEDPVGCRGIQVPGYAPCLAHLTDIDRSAYLAGLVPGTDIDHRGTPLTEPLLDDLLGALRDPATGHPCFGAAEFHSVTFEDVAMFDSATFHGDAEFGSVTFQDAWFDSATFSGEVEFTGAATTDRFWFRKAQFETAAYVNFVCGRLVLLDMAVFHQPVMLSFAARRVSCGRTRWAATASLHLTYAKLHLDDAVFEYPVSVTGALGPYRGDAPLPEGLVSQTPGVSLATVVGADVAHLALHNIDVSECEFAGAVHLDQMRVDGWCTFATTPSGWNRRFPWRWSQRNTLVEEHYWRVRNARHPAEAVARGWATPPQHAPELKPAAVAALYRQLRKSLEDGKNEPDAADFYYGECEMRRHDTTRPWGERTLLTAYWALSGYGLRATRALGWLVTAMAATIMVMVLWGLPANDPNPQTTGQQVGAGQKLKLTTDTPDPRNPTGPLGERVSTERFEKALRVVINSVVFRSSGQDLTTAGTYTEMTSRLAEPVLLGLAVLAVRGRVKR